jgi:hypothetical protein
MTMPIDFNRWVNDNNPDEHLQYRKGWWDYIEIVRRLAGKFEIDDGDIQVISTFAMKTPPPTEALLMPVFQIKALSAEFILKYDFGVYPEAWTVSVWSQLGSLQSMLGLFDPNQDLCAKHIAGFQTEWVYGPYCQDASRFSCEVRDEWDLACLFRLVLTRR